MVNLWSWIKRGWESMKVGRREFAWVFPELLIAWSNEQWELHESWRESFFSFRFPCFCSLLPRFLFLRFLTLVNLLTVRVITPIVTCRWYVIIFSFFLLLLMGNDLEIAGLLLQLSTTLVQLSWPVKRAKPHIDLIKIWTSSKLMRVDERWWELAVKRAKPLMDSRQNLNQLKVDESAWELMRVGGQTRARVVTLIHSHPRLIRPYKQSCRKLTFV